ncbi:MAG: AraC family transcriptional regulator [Gammaproteobacteria bacterium]|nr:AraC family transcriptional regulator [Gammaproteobacteria bacterium]
MKHAWRWMMPLWLASTLVLAGPEAPPAAEAVDGKAMDQQVQGLKDEVLDLNRELFMLEEELLFPANTQVAVFVSMDVGEYFALDSVQLTLDGKPVSKYLYTEREARALNRGGVHRLYLGNLKAGGHELVAIFTGQGSHERDYRRGATLKFEKGIGAKFVELAISDRASKMQPEFMVREWE